MLAEPKYHVVVDSVGTAAPSVSSLLAQGLELPVEMVTRAIYNAPAILFSGVTESVADNAMQLLTRLGLEVSLHGAGQALPQAGDTVEVGAHISDIEKLPAVCRQLAAFLGCEPKEALSLLVNEPGIVIGNVSRATAAALAKRLDAEIVISDPRTDLYTIEAEPKDRFMALQMQDALKSYGISADMAAGKTIAGFSFTQAQAFWKRFQHHQAVTIINQSFMRYEIILEQAEPGESSIAALSQLTGMCGEVGAAVLESLPVQLEESVGAGEVEAALDRYRQAGLQCKAYLLSTASCYVRVENLAQLARVNEILKDYFTAGELPKAGGSWQTPKPMKRLMARYIAWQLEQAGCETELITAQ